MKKPRKTAQVSKSPKQKVTPKKKTAAPKAKHFKATKLTSSHQYIAVVDQLRAAQRGSDELLLENLDLIHSIEQQEYKETWRRQKSDRKIARLETEIERVNIRINDIYSSSSWRVTKLFRVVSQMFGSKERRRVKSHIKIVAKSGMFDSDWYLDKYEDIEQLKMDPIEHFVRYGSIEGRSPGPHFNSQQYLDKNPHLLLDNVNPLLHYLESKEI